MTAGEERRVVRIGGQMRRGEPACYRVGCDEPVVALVFNRHNTYAALACDAHAHDRRARGARVGWIATWEVEE